MNHDESRMNTGWMKGRGWCLVRWVSLWILVFAAHGRAEPVKKSASTFYFVQITDTHWGARDGVSLTRRAVATINSLPVKVEFVVLTGDLFSDSIGRDEVVSDGLAAMKPLKMPVYYLPGNHDITKIDHRRTQKIFEDRFGPLNRSVDIQGVRCLFMCTEMQEGETRSPGQVERTWLEQQMVENKAHKPVLVFMHRPPIRDMINGSDGAVSWDDQYDSRWERTFDEHPEIKAVFAGHLHRDELCWISGVPVYVSSALARFWDRQPSFRLYEYKEGRMNYWTLYPEYRKEEGKTFRTQTFTSQH